MLYRWYSIDYLDWRGAYVARHHKAIKQVALTKFSGRTLKIKMKVINHHKGNYTFADSSDGSVMYGTIRMTEEEYNKAIEILRQELYFAKKKFNTYTRDALTHVFNWVLPNHGQDKRICLGVTATELLFKYYKLSGYKKQNYVIERRNK